MNQTIDLTEKEICIINGFLNREIKENNFIISSSLGGKYLVDIAKEYNKEIRIIKGKLNAD